MKTLHIQFADTYLEFQVSLKEVINLINSFPKMRYVKLGPHLVNLDKVLYFKITNKDGSTFTV